jgi:hypothetical protein
MNNLKQDIKPISLNKYAEQLNQDSFLEGKTLILHKMILQIQKNNFNLQTKQSNLNTN